MNNALIIASHPDDEVLGCGGTIARLVDEGLHKVHVLILGEGMTSRGKTEDLGLLATNSRQAAQILGVSGTTYFNLPDNKFDTVPLLMIVKKIEEEIEKTKPTVVFTQHSGDCNIDHALTYKATLAATRPEKRCPVRSLFAYPVRSSTEWSFNNTFVPNAFVDITGYVDLKIEAMKAYKTEIREYPHPRSEKALRDTASFYGSIIGKNAAEPFMIIRSIL